MNKSNLLKDRREALKWWRSQSPDNKQKIITSWKSSHIDFRKNWTLSMIDASTSTILLLWYLHNHTNILEDVIQNPNSTSK